MSSTSKKAKEATKARKGGANRIVVTPACESHGTAVESTAAPHKQDSASVDDELVLSQIAKASKSTNVHAADRVSNLGAPRERQEFTELRAVASAPHTVRIVVCVPRSWRVVQHEEKTEKTEKTEKNEKEKPDSRVDDGDDDDDAFVDATTMLLLPTDTINDVIAALSDALPLVTRVRLALADGVALDPSLQIGALTTRLSSASSSSITLSPFVPTRLFAKRAVYDIGSVIAHIDRFVTVVDVASFRTPEFDEQAPAISEFIVPRDVLAVPLAASIAAANEIPDSHYDVLGVVDKAVAASLTDFYPTILAGAPVDSCVRSVTLSSANPPSRARTAGGDLLYIDVALPDNEFVGITATRAGFIVNRSTATHVNVEPRAAAETWPHLWCALAGQVAKFRERLATVLLARSTSIAMLSSSSALPLSRFPAVFVAPPTRAQATGGLLASWRATSWLLRSVSESACREVLSTVFVTPSQGELQVMRGVEPRTYRDAQVCDKVLTQLHMQLGLLGLAGLRTLEAGGGLSSENSASVYNGTFVARVVPDFAIDELAAKTEDPDVAVRRSALEHAQRAAEKAAGNEIRVLRVLSSWQRPVPAMPDSAAADGAAEGEALSAFEAQARGSAELDAPHTIAACVIDWCGHRYQAQPSISESLIINPDRALVYGCLHDTDKFAADDETALRAARTLAARLHVKSVTHTTPAATEGDAPQTHQLPLGSYAKGVRGSDGRLYFLELGHTMPPDTTSSCPSAKHRPELVTLFHRDAMRVALAEKNAKAAAANKEKEGAAAAKGDATTDAPAATTDAPAVATTTTTTTTAAAAESTDATNATSAAAATTTTAPAAPAAAPVATGDAAATTTETPVADPKPEGSGAQDEFMHEFDLRLRASHVIVEHLSSTWTAVAPTIRAQLLADDPSAAAADTSALGSETALRRETKPLFNADCYGSRAATVDAADKEALASLDAFLRERSIPVATERLLADVPLDGDELCAMLHEFGVPLRRLNAIAVKANALALERRPIFDHSSSIVQSLCVEEMVARAAKQCFKVYMQNGQRAEDALNGVEPHVAVADFLNCFLGSQAGQKPKNANAISQQEATLARDAFAVTPYSLWVQIRARLKAHFEYEAPATLISTLSRARLLRVFSNRVGIQLRLQVFKFNSPAFLHARDIARIYPRVKFVEFTSALGESMLNQGRQWLRLARSAPSHNMLDNLLERAFEYANMALTHATNTGAVSELNIVCQEFMQEVASAREEAARNHLDMVRELFVREQEQALADGGESAALKEKIDEYARGMVELADHHEFLMMSLVDTTHSALGALERTCGALHHRTVRAYRRVALALANAERFAVAGDAMRRAIYLLALLSPNHPELPMWISNYADILLAAGRVPLALAYGAESLSRDSQHSPHHFELLGSHVQRLMRAEQYVEALPLAQRYQQHMAARAARDPRFQPDAELAQQIVATLVTKAVSLRKQARESGQDLSKITIEMPRQQQGGQQGQAQRGGAKRAQKHKGRQ